MVELARTRSRVQQLKSQLQAQRTEAEKELSASTDELDNKALAL